MYLFLINLDRLIPISCIRMYYLKHSFQFTTHLLCKFIFLLATSISYSANPTLI